MPSELAQDVPDIVFVNTQVLLHSSGTASGLRSVMDDLLLVLQADLGTGDKGDEKDGVSLSTLIASHAPDAEGDHIAVRLYLSIIEAIEDEGTGLPAGAFQLVDGEGIDNTVITILRKLETVCINLYHGSCKA